jgi:hypothetical protein
MPPSGLGGDGEEPPSSLGALTSAKIKRLFDYWLSLCEGRKFPAWEDVKLMDVYDLAPYLAVMDVEKPDVEDAPLRFRYRFCGTWLVESRTNLAPIDPTGHCLDEIAWPFDSAPLINACARVVELQKPALLEAGVVEESLYHLHERGFFPLGDDEGAVRHILVCVDEVEGG